MPAGTTPAKRGSGRGWRLPPAAGAGGSVIVSGGAEAPVQQAAHALQEEWECGWGWECESGCGCAWAPP